MSDPIVVLPLDLTGANVDNLIEGEVHSPPAGTTRLIIPRFGAFYAESLVVVNAVDQTPVDSAFYKMADVWKTATEQSSQTVVKVIVLYAGAPASVAITYQGFGGPQSRNAQELLAWFNEKANTPGATIDFEDLKDFPSKIDPSEHMHLASHLYGFEYITDALERLTQALQTGGQDGRAHLRAAVTNRISGLYDRTITTVDGIVQAAFFKWRDEINLFYLGVDQLENVGLLSMSEAVAAVAGSFVVQNPEDERYVSLSGLGTFCRGLAERLLLRDTGIGSEFAVMRDPHRGSLLTAKVGSVFMVPTQNVAITMSSRYKEIYPTDYPLDVPMIVEKVGAHPRDRAGLFMAYHPTLGHSWIGLLIDSRFTTRIHWFRRYFKDEQLDIEKMLQDHAAAIGNVHQEDKEQLGLGNIENLPIVTVDDILSATPVDKLHTLATLLYTMRAWLENVELPLGENGEVDMSTNPLLLPKVIFAPCAVGKDEGSIRFVESFCDGSDKYVKWTNGKGGFEDKLAEQNSDDCKYVMIPERGKSLGRYCDPVTMNTMERFADGRGGSTSEIVFVKDPACGYVKPLEIGTQITEFCLGVNMMRRYADGKGGFTDVPILINTVKCDGTNFESPGTGTGTGGTSKAKITIASTHNKIYSGTLEILSIYFTGFLPNTQYTASLYAQSPALWDNVASEMLVIPFRTGATGSFTKELSLLDEGVAPRGVYDNWVVMLTENLESNHITRTFLAGAAPGGVTDPNSDTGGTRPDGGTVGTGDTDTKPDGETYTDIDGNEYGAGAWPPRPRFNPLIQLSTDRPIIYPGDNETQSASCTGFMVGQSYTLRYYFASTAYNGGARTESFSVNFVAASDGRFVHTLHLYDDGTLPRGTYVCTAEVDNYSSASITRTFMATGEGGVKPKPSPSVTYSCSHTTIVKNTVYTETVVLTGHEPNTKYTVGVTGGYWDGALMGGLRAYFVATTDANGSYRWERTSIDDGVTVVRAAYQIRASVVENGLMSATAFVSYMDGIEVGGPGTQIPKLDYASTLVRISAGDTETQTVTLSNAPPNKSYDIEWWIQSPSLNGNQLFLTTITPVMTNAQGIGTAVLTTTDDGTTVPRGDYQCYASCKVLNIKSTTITRTFLGAGGSTPPTVAPSLKDALLSFGTSHPTITMNTVETQTITLTKFIPNTDYAVQLWIRSAALGNGNQALNTVTVNVRTNASGSGTATLTITDNGTVPRGEYQSWAVCQNVTSNTVVRTFSGPTANLNPVVSYSTNLATITAGSNEIQTINLTGAQPNTAYTLQFWTQSPALNNNSPFNGESRSVVTNGAGAASTSLQTYDDGVTVPRGTYSSWARVPELNITSPAVTRVFVGTPAPTQPPFNPQVSYWTDRSTLYFGVYETHTIAIGGMRANTTYNVQIWIQSSALWGGVASHMTTLALTTNASGSASTSFGQPDDGVTPRGVYSNWAVIAETGTASPAFTRVFT